MASSTNIYGAEDLGQRYPRHALWSLCFAVLITLGAALYPIIKAALQKPSEEKISVTATRVINYAELAAPPPIDLERKPPDPLVAPPESKMVKYLPPVVKKDEEVPDEETLPTMDDLGKALIGTANVEGVDSVYVEYTEVELAPAPEPPPTYEPFTFVEVMPEYMGGQEALYAYLSENLKYPAIAREAEIQGTVFVSFIIETDGRITDVQVVRSVHPMLDAEAVRVVSEMPRWKPGKQNQADVRVRFTLPIGFRLRGT